MVSHKEECAGLRNIHIARGGTTARWRSEAVHPRRQVRFGSRTVCVCVCVYVCVCVGVYPTLLLFFLSLLSFSSTPFFLLLSLSHTPTHTHKLFPSLSSLLAFLPFNLSLLSRSQQRQVCELQSTALLRISDNSERTSSYLNLFHLLSLHSFIDSAAGCERWAFHEVCGEGERRGREREKERQRGRNLKFLSLSTIGHRSLLPSPPSGVTWRHEIHNRRGALFTERL